MIGWLKRKKIDTPTEEKIVEDTTVTSVEDTTEKMEAKVEEAVEQGQENEQLQQPQQPIVEAEVEPEITSYTLHDAPIEEIDKHAHVIVGSKEISMENLVNCYLNKRKVKKKEKKAVLKRRLEKSLKPYQAELIKLQTHLEKTNQKMIILFEGRDAAGKGGTIRRVTRYMNEKHYRIVALGKPTEEQRGQWFYQKYIKHFPTAGEIVLFDRSWYNRAMVEQVFGFCSKKEYDDFMNGVKDFEKDLTTQGIILIKLYFSVTKSEQANRFERRKTDPLRQWKLSEIDMQAQERWDDFTNTKYTMIKETHSYNAPWSIIRSNDKHLARKEAMKIILNSVDYEGRSEDIDFSLDPDIVISGAREIEIMDVQMHNRGKFIN